MIVSNTASFSIFGNPNFLMLKAPISIRSRLEELLIVSERVSEMGGGLVDVVETLLAPSLLPIVKMISNHEIFTKQVQDLCLMLNSCNCRSNVFYTTTYNKLNI